MSEKRDQQPGEPPEPELPEGVKLLRTIKGPSLWAWGLTFSPSGRTLAGGGSDKTVTLWEVNSGRVLNTLTGHMSFVSSVTFDTEGSTLASASNDGTVRLWELPGGKPLRNLKGHSSPVRSVAFNPKGWTLASGSVNGGLKLWDVETRRLFRTLDGHRGIVFSVAFDPEGSTLASGSSDGAVKIWEADSGRHLRTLGGHEESVLSVAFNPKGRTLVSAGDDKTVKVWDVGLGKLLRTLEGHIGMVDTVAFSGDGRLFASKSSDGTVRLWSCETWETVAIIPEPSLPISTNPDYTHLHTFPGLAFHPGLPLLATAGSAPGRGGMIHIWELDFDVLLREAPEVRPAVKAVHHTTAKVVLVGDSGVGKTGLGWRLAHGEFKEHSSTHGQQFWVVDELGTRREDGTECEAILWDLAGQPDYRLTHALFLDDADLALVLFDPTDSRDPLHGVEFWLKQLKSGRKGSGEAEDCCPTILVGARADRGEGRLTQEELDEFCQRRGIGGGYLATSANVGTGLEELLRRMREQIAWEQKPATVTTVTFKRIKDFVLGLKESPEQKEVIVSPEELRGRLQDTDKAWEFTDAEMMTAVGHLANYGYVRVLRTSKGEERVLLAPELLNNLAASFVLEARRNPKGLGSLEEKRLLEAGYSFPELEKLSPAERDILLDSAALLFLEHNVCFRETALGGQSYLVFPELINLKRPLLEDEHPTEEGMSYTISGAVENVYASLVVLLGYTQTFTRTDQWQNQARYVMGDGSVCGFRQEETSEGELNFLLYFGENVPKPGRKVFEALFESFLARRNVTVFRYEPIACRQGHAINRAVVRARLRDKKDFAFCEECGERAMLPKASEPIRLTQTEQRKVDEQQWFAARRSLFERAVFQVVSYAEGEKLKRPECFISYAWGDREHERWVEMSLAMDLRKAGINVLLDKWENSLIGSSILRFVERIEACDYLIAVGTPLYRKKTMNMASEQGSVAAAEWELAGLRMLAGEADKKTVLPALLSGEASESFPPLLRGRVYADFRDERAYFSTAFDLILRLYDIAPNYQAVADLRESLRDSDSPLEAGRSGRVR